MEEYEVSNVYLCEAHSKLSYGGVSELSASAKALGRVCQFGDCIAKATGIGWLRFLGSIEVKGGSD